MSIGSARKDPKRGTWYFVIDAPGPDGKRRQVRRRGFPTKGAAVAALDRFRAQLAAGHVPVPADDTVAGFAASWVGALPAEGLEPGTVKHYKESIDRLLPAIGDVRLQDLSALDLDGAYGVLLDAGRSARTVRASHVAVRKMLAEARRLRKVARNVAGEARPPRARAARAKRYPTWTYEQTVTFLGAVADHEHVALWHVAALTGMRRGELVALRWADVDLDAQTVTVARSVGKGLDGTHVKEPKSDAGRRTVELDGPLVDVLRRHRQAQLERRLALGEGWRDHDLVFCEVDGSPIHPDRLSRRWTDLVRRHAPGLDMPAIRFHDLRHSHCHQLLDAGVRPDVVTERLGHSSVAFTLQQYGHRWAGDQRSGLARLRQLP
ncbi:MAG: site-specific integrase [Acidimicrobiia bacterium]|nr:site-specific integrase [Acidimicrobiia bacterium]